MTDFEQERFQLNLDRIAAEPSFLAVTRFLAKRLLDNPYITIEEFLVTLSNEDLKIIQAVCEHVMHEDEDEQTRVEELILIANMLALGEGLDNANLDIVVERANQLSMFITLESLKRKGLVKLIYENMSFGEDMGDKPIVEKL